MAKSSIKKNFVYQMIYEILILILPFVTSPYISRVIGADGLGTYSYSYSVAYYFVLISMLGLKNYGNRAIAQAREDQDKLNTTFSSVLVLHILISVICSTTYIGYCMMIREDRIYALIQTAYVLSGLFDISWFFFGMENFKLTVTRNIIIRLLNVTCVFVFVNTADDLWKYCLIMSIGNLISQMSLWLPLRKYVKIVRPSWKEMKVHLKPMMILFIPAIAVSLYKYMDKIMIRILSDKRQLGFYENAEKVNNVPITIIGSFGTVMLPKMSNLAAKAKKELSAKYIGISMQYVMCLAIGLTFGMAAVAKVFAPVFWGSEFIMSGTIIMFLSITVPFISFANVIRTQYLIPNAKDKEYMFSVIMGAVVNLITNYLLIPHHGAMGATVGTIFAEITVCLLQCIAVRKNLQLLQYFKSFAFFLADGAVMFVFVYWIGSSMSNSVLSLILQVLVGGVIYAGIAGIYLFVRKDETFFNLLENLKLKLKR